MRPLPYPSKGLVLEPNISAAPCLRVYYGYNAPVFENDEVNDGRSSAFYSAVIGR